MTETWQDHATTADNGDPKVTYTYEDGSDPGAQIPDYEAKYVRPDYVTYPGPSTRRKVYYHYTDSTAANESNWTAQEKIGQKLSRLRTIAAVDIDSDPIAGADANATYTYLGAGTVVKVAYPAVTGTPALTYGTSTNSYPGFDRFGRVVEQKWAAGATVKDQFKYGYDRTSNRLYRTNELNHDLDELYHANGATGAYDGLDRLTDFRRGALTDTNSDGVLDTVADNSISRVQEWTLDPVGNWSGFKSTVATTQPWDLDQARLHNKANEIQAISGTNADWVNPAYDLAGNMTAGPQPRYETVDANTQWYKYDAWNRLVRLGQGASSPGTLVATYSYDGQNRRIRKVVEAGESDITYDYYYNESWQVLEVRKGGSANSYEQYVWGVQYVDAPVVRFQDSDTNGTLNNTLYYTYDAQFNVTALIEPDGDVVERYVYDPYGQVTIYDGTWSSTRASSSFDNCIMYCGYWFDKESGNYIARRRYLTPPLGRWLTPDPIVHGDGMNRYQYVGGNPAVYSDPIGTQTTGPAQPEKFPPRRFMDSKDFFVSGTLTVNSWMGWTTPPGVFVLGTLWMKSEYAIQDNYIKSTCFNNFATTNLSLSLSEFGVQNHGSPTPRRAADILAGTLRLCFGHEKMTTFMMWGFWRPRMWRTAPAGALMDADWKITPAGMVWQQMTGVRNWHIANLPVWTTDVSVVTDEQGRASFVGFYGDYEIISGRQRGEFTLTKGTTSYQAAVSRS